MDLPSVSPVASSPLGQASPKRPLSAGGFTILELIFVVFILGILMALAWPFLDSAIDQSRYVECQGRLESIRRAKSLYVVDHLGQGSPSTTNDRGTYLSYFVEPFFDVTTPPSCPRLAPGDALYSDPYNVYALTVCPFCANNVPAGTKAQPPVIP